MPPLSPQDLIRDWRQRFLLWILRAYLGFASIAAVAGIGLALTQGAWGIVFFDVGAWLFAIVLAVLPDQFRRLKIAGVLATTYGVGLFFTLGFGPFAAGPFWLFAGPMIAGALLGWRSAAASLALLIATLGGIGVLLDGGRLDWPTEFGVGLWIVISGSLIALSGMLAVSVAMLLDGLEHAHRERERESEAREQLEEHLRHAQKMEAVGRLAGGVAHDFNNLLTVVMGFTELAMSDLEETGSTYHDLSEVTRIVDRGRRLTGQLLAFTRSDASAPRIVDLNLAITEADRLIEQLAGPDVRVELHLAPAPCYALVDPDSLSQILANATVNAKDAMREGGSLSIETKPISMDEGDGVAPGDYTLVSISDDGEGISEEIVDKVFDPFFTTKDEGKGTGLGLSTCWAIAEQAGGALRIRSEPGRGTSLDLYLPKAPAPTTSDSQPSVPAPSAGQEKILVVEDQRPVREAIARTLQAQGYEVIEASDAEAALTILRESAREVDLLLTDVIMPGTDGHELVQRAEEIHPGLPTLFVSGYSGQVLAERGLLREGISLLKKPFSMTDLATRVRQVIDEAN